MTTATPAVAGNPFGAMRADPVAVAALAAAALTAMSVVERTRKRPSVPTVVPGGRTTVFAGFRTAPPPP